MHNILGGKAFAYVGEPAWHGLGREVPETVTAAEMIKAAGLDWTVEKRPARGAGHRTVRDGTVIYNRYELIRAPRDLLEKEVLLATVTHRYEPLQNDRAFAFFEPFIRQKLARFQTAGALGDGERVWVLVKLNDDIEVAPGDAVQRFLLLSNSHDGRGAVTVKFTPIRVVCQNTLNLALGDGTPALKAPHTPRLELRLGEVQVAQMGEIIAKVFKNAATRFAQMARIKMNDERLYDYFDLVFPSKKKEKGARNEPERWSRWRDLFEADESNPAAVRGTLWAAYNAITYDEDHRVQNGVDGERRLNRIWFGDGADLKARALDRAAELAATWA